jgi:hypothetical protein
VAASVLASVRTRIVGLKRPMRIVARPTGPSAFDPALYRPTRLMTFRPRGIGSSDASKHARVDVMTCWVDDVSGLLGALVTGVEVGREAVARTMPPDAVHAYSDDAVRLSH